MSNNPRFPKSIRLIILAAVLLLIAVAALTRLQPIFAQTSGSCSAPYYVDQTLPTGARWQMCWEHRSLEGIVLYDVYFTPAGGGTTRKLLAQASLAQIFVPYDDNGARFHDVTDYGAGGSNMNDLTPADCPGGTLLQHSGKDVLCLQIAPRGYAHKYYTNQLQGYALSLWSVSHIGEYNYITVWEFLDDGTIAPSMGATGQLQRFGSNTNYGWPLGANVGISHVHSFYWRLDFDLDTSANELVEQFDFNPAASNAQRIIATSPILTEAAISANPDLMRSWRIKDTVLTNSDGHAISYHLEPLEVGHRYVGPTSEPWTNNIFYVTSYNACEKFASHNPTTGGCANNVAAFVNGQNTNGQDIVLWYGVTFHHLPRDEDQPKMHVHWSGFQMAPRDWTATNPLALVTPQTTFTPNPSTPTATHTPLPPTPTATHTPVPPTPTATATYTPIPPTATATSTPTGNNTGWHSPTANLASIGGDGNGFEVDPANGYGDDGLFALDINSGTNKLINCGGSGKDQHIYYNYNLPVPAGSTIEGIEVRLDAKADNTAYSPRLCVQFSWDGGTNWTAARTTPTLTTAEATYLLGNPTDVWGRAWTSGQFVNSNFRVRISALSSDLNRDFSLDWVAVRVFYH